MINDPKDIGKHRLAIQQQNMLGMVMDALNCSKQEGLMYLASLRALEKQHPEYHLNKIPPKDLLKFIAVTRTKVMDNQNLDRTLNSGQQDNQNLDKVLQTQ